jgi:hypothetical protein
VEAREASLVGLPVGELAEELVGSPEAQTVGLPVVVMEVVGVEQLEQEEAVN